MVLCLVGLVIYCLCEPKQPSDKSVIAKPPKAVDGPRNQQQDQKSAARTTRKNTKQKHGSSAVHLKTKAARQNLEKLGSQQASDHSFKGLQKNGKSSSKRTLAGPNALSSKAARVH